MKRFKCSICNYMINSEKEPVYCENCGSQGIKWEIISAGLTEFSLVTEDEKLIVYKELKLDRKLVKQFFENAKDKDGNQIYKYFDKEKPLLEFVRKEDGSFQVFMPFSLKNHFYLNEIKLEKTKIELRKNDRLRLFSSSRSEFIIDFIVV